MSDPSSLADRDVREMSDSELLVRAVWIGDSAAREEIACRISYEMGQSWMWGALDWRRARYYWRRSKVRRLRRLLLLETFERSARLFASIVGGNVYGAGLREIACKGTEFDYDVVGPPVDHLRLGTLQRLYIVLWDMQRHARWVERCWRIHYGQTGAETIGDIFNLTRTRGYASVAGHTNTEA